MLSSILHTHPNQIVSLSETKVGTHAISKKNNCPNRQELQGEFGQKNKRGHKIKWKENPSPVASSEQRQSYLLSFCKKFQTCKQMPGAQVPNFAHSETKARREWGRNERTENQAKTWGRELKTRANPGDRNENFVHVNVRRGREMKIKVGFSR